MTDMKFSRGSEWRKWDLHIHTPASFHWNGERFKSDPCSPENATLVDEMICSLNAAEPAVFAVMDYWTFDGWFALKHRLAQPDAPNLEKTVFPGIELRLMAPMKGRLNAHVLFSDKIDDQELIDFKSNLRLEFPGEEARNLSKTALIEYARFVSDEKLKHHGLEKDRAMNDDNYAHNAGAIMAELTCESYKQAILKVKNNQAVGFMPFDTSDGLTGIKRNEHYAYVLGLFKSSPIFETRNIDLWEAFSGIKTERNENWIDDFQLALDHIPRLAVSGSDAHCFSKVTVQTPSQDLDPQNDNLGSYSQNGRDVARGSERLLSEESVNNDRRGYGDYPSDKITWIKANPTFEGLQQAIKEPSKRSFIGKQPPKKIIFNENKSLYIDKLIIQKVDGASLPDKWLDQTVLKFNPDLIAIIGNKGSGKSALADITALLGNSKQSHHFSFLNRFKGKTGVPAKHFTAQATWADGQTLEKNLSETPAIENVELVKYIPQGHFEELCNAHVSGESDAFEQELRSVIFSHADDTIRRGSHDFDRLIEKQESSLTRRLDGLRGELHTINRQIDSIEQQMLPEARRKIEELLAQKQRLLNEHNKIMPLNVDQPTGVLSEEQQKISEKLASVATELEKIKKKKEKNQEELTLLAAKRKASHNIQEGVDVVRRAIQHFVTELNNDAKSLGIKSNAFFQFKINEQLITQISSATSAREAEVRKENQELERDKNSLIEKRAPLNAQLNAPQQAYQQYLAQLTDWKEKEADMLGSEDSPDTLKGLKYRKKQLDFLPKQRTLLQTKRSETTAQIFDLIDEQRSNRESLFKPIQHLISNNRLIRDEYKLMFKAELNSTAELISDRLFSLVKQSSGEFRGESESLLVIKELTDRHDLNDKQSLLEFVTELHDKLENSSKEQVGILSLLRKNHSANEVYDFLFGLTYLKPRYTLMFQGAEIEQLSPGQRGALLLIFYLLVDKGNTPIILDQPEENLDNETIVKLLVPVLNEAKQKRQIIMATHNPNLAVVCDAEQIIHCAVDRTNGHNITYTPGAIECRVLNKKVVDVLEGTMPAFDNRRTKYH